MNQDLSLNLICDLRKKWRLSTLPSIRLTLTSPYPQFTQNQLDMRRKAEILKYDNLGQNKKLTKKEKWSQLVNVNTRNRRYVSLVNYDSSGNYTVTRKDSVLCPNDQFISTPTYASNIPGPIMNLTYDKSVPLYNYITNNDTYSIINTDQTLSRYLVLKDDTLFLNEKETELVTLFIGTNSKEATRKFNFTIPIGIYFIATQIKASLLNSPVVLLDNSLNITSVNVNVYFGNSLVTPVTVPNIYLSNNGKKYYFAQNQKFSTNFTINFTPINTNDAVKISVFSGTLHIENLGLVTNPGLVYTIKATFVVTSSIAKPITFRDTFSYNVYGVTGNLTLPNAAVTQNCTIPLLYNTPIPTIYPSFTIF